MREYQKRVNKLQSLYQTFPKLSSLSNAEFWCLEVIRTKQCTYQHEISEVLYMSKQTINSALKHMVKLGILQMVIPEENQRVRKLVLTEQGEKISSLYVDSMLETEKRAWDHLSMEEQKLLISILSKLIQYMSEETQEYGEK